MAKIIHLVYIIIISVLAILLWQDRGVEQVINATDTEAPNIAQPSSNFETTRNLEALVGELQAQNRALEMRIARQEEVITDLRPDEIEIAENSAETEAGSDSDQPRSVGIEALTRAMKNASEGFLSEDDMNTRRELEPVDPNWAYPLEQDLQDFFIVQEEFRDIQLTSVECRTTYCELKLETQPGSSFNTSVMNQYLREKEWFENGMIMAFENPETGVATVIIETGRKINE